MLWQKSTVQLPGDWPPALKLLQAPRTASSGRRLIALSMGGSYGFAHSTFLVSWFIGTSLIGSRTLQHSLSLQWLAQLPQIPAEPLALLRIGRICCGPAQASTSISFL
jgi:hypothetical protein